MLRCFVAIPFPTEIKKHFKSIYKFLSQNKNLKIVSLENLHITLKFLGNIQESMVNKIDSILSSINYTSFNISFKNPGVFLNRGKPKVFFINIFSDSLKNITLLIDNKLEMLGFKKDDRDFRPHLTLARVKGFIDKSFTQTFLDYKIEEISFKVVNFVLYKSDLRPEGPIYTELRSYKLY